MNISDGITVVYLLPIHLVNKIGRFMVPRLLYIFFNLSKPKLLLYCPPHPEVECSGRYATAAVLA